jgi:anti-sigma factor ChrR (cupin superfamily)
MGKRSDPYRNLAGAFALAALEEPVSPRDPSLRQQLLDLAGAPTGRIDTSAHAWQELAPGIKVQVVHEEPARGMRACLVWALPGARNERHRHGGDEVILVLQGSLRDENGTYGPGQICRSRKGSTHTEEALPGDDCFCYVVYYGPLEFLDAAD